MKEFSSFFKKKYFILFKINNKDIKSIRRIKLHFIGMVKKKRKKIELVLRLSSPKFLL